MTNCSNHSCNYNIAPDYFISYSKYKKTHQKKINEYEKYEKILDALIKTELFCIKCCVQNTILICNNSNIPMKN